MSTTNIIRNSAAAKVFRSADGVAPAWVAEVRDAVVSDVLLTGDHVKQKWPQVAVGETVEASTGTGNGSLEVSFTVGGAFQESQACKAVSLDRGSTATVVYFVVAQTPTWPSVRYGLQIDGADPIDLGEAVLGSTIGA